MLGTILNFWESSKAFAISLAGKIASQLPGHQVKQMAAKPSPGPIALQAILDAEANIGVHEVGNNSGQYVDTYLHSVGLSAGNPWCQAFVFYRLISAAQKLGLKVPEDYPRTGYTPAAADWGKKKGLWIPVQHVISGIEAPRRGDLVYYYMPSMGRISHVGIVAEVNATGCITVEGNTSDSTGLNRDGGGVWRKNRPWSSLGAYGGFVRLPW